MEALQVSPLWVTTSEIALSARIHFLNCFHTLLFILSNFKIPIYWVLASNYQAISSTELHVKLLGPEHHFQLTENSNWVTSNYQELTAFEWLAPGI